MNRLEYYKRRYTRAYSIFTQWISLLQACQHYTVPHRDIFYYTNYTQGTQKNGKVYDTTAVAATRTFVSKIQNALTPPQQVWAYLEAGINIPEEQRQMVNEYLQRTTDVIFNYLRHSNFDLAVSECYYDLAIGTAIMVINEGDTDEQPLRFYSIPLAQLAFEESINGYIESAYRTWGEVKISEIEIMWPNAILPSWMIAQLEQDPNATIKNLYEGVIYCHGDKKPYKYVLWIDSDIMLEEEDDSSKWIIFRWSKINNEVMGRGPVMDALPSILSLNEIARLELTSANLNICKPYMAYSDGVFNPWTFKLEPNTVIPISPLAGSSGNYPLIPMPDVANPAFMQLTSMDLRQQINKLLFAEPLGPVNTPTRTATELALRQRSLAEEIGPLFTRLQQEFLSRVISRVMRILEKRGLIEKLVINGETISVRYQSPLVIAQGQQDVNTFVEYAQILQAIYGPEYAVANLNPVETPMWIAEKLGIDKKLIPTKEGIEQMLEQQMEKQQEMEDLQMGAMSAEVPRAA